MLQRCFTISAVLVALPYSSALHNSFACAQGFSLMVTKHKSTALKVSGTTEDIFFSFCWSKKKNCFWTTDITLSVNIGLASLHYAQNYPSTVSKTLQLWCWAFKAFYHTSLLPLCNVFCHAYEKSLKWLEIGYISSLSKHKPR